jgi:hypothetical protein
MSQKFPMVKQDSPKMDVLEYWVPDIDWAQFHAGPVSAEMWTRFKQLVQLCHAYRYWQGVARQQRREPLSRPLYPESKYMRNKRRHEHRRNIERSEGHMYRAAYLAAEKMAEMSFLISKDDEGKPDWNLWWSLRLALAYQPSHERARCNAAAFEEFTADQELRNGDPLMIANRWLERAGYTDRLSPPLRNETK